MEWFKDWFESDEYLQMYKHRDDKEARDLIDLLLKQLRINTGTDVLDIACGAGRHPLVFAEKKFKVTAFDLSKNLLKIARDRAKIQEYKINFFCADVRNLGLKKQFDLIINLFTSFGYFESDEENFSLFTDAFKYLKSSGYFIFDYFNIDYLQNHLIPESITSINNKKIIQQRFLENGRIKKDIIITFNGIERKYHESVKLYSFEKLTCEMEKTGFEIVKVFGDYRGSYFNRNESQRIIIIAKK